MPSRPPFAKLVQGAVFGVALTLVVFAGAELFTGNAMVMLQGLAAGRVRPTQLLGVWAASLIGNVAGSIGFAALVHGAGTLHAGSGGKLVASGFEHSIANATVFALGVFEGSATWSMLARNLAWTVPGNLVGGGLLVGLAYAWMGRASIRRPGVALTPRAATPGEPVPVAPATPALANAAVATDLAGG